MNMTRRIIILRKNKLINFRKRIDENVEMRLN